MPINFFTIQVKQFELNDNIKTQESSTSQTGVIYENELEGGETGLSGDYVEDALSLVTVERTTPAVHVDLFAVRQTKSLIAGVELIAKTLVDDHVIAADVQDLKCR